MRFLVGVILAWWSSVVLMWGPVGLVDGVLQLDDWITWGIQFVLFLGSFWLIAENADSAGQVIRRGALLGAAEWLLYIPFGVLSGIIVPVVQEGPAEEQFAQAMLGIVGSPVLGFFMALACVLVYLIARWMAKEM